VLYSQELCRTIDAFNFPVGLPQNRQNILALEATNLCFGEIIEFGFIFAF